MDLNLKSAKLTFRKPFQTCPILTIRTTLQLPGACFMLFLGMKPVLSGFNLLKTNMPACNRIPESNQEPITRSIQLPCIRATAFSQVGLFLDLSVLPVKISVSDDVHIRYTNFHKWNVGQALSDLNEFWCPYSLSACLYCINQKLFLLKTRFPTIQCVLITCCSISLQA